MTGGDAMKLTNRLKERARIAAMNLYALNSDNDIEIMADAKVTKSADEGLWIEARLYVRLSDIEANQ